MEKPQEIMTIGLDFDVAADLMVRATKIGIETAIYLEILVLTGAYGMQHPRVKAFYERARLGVSGTETRINEEGRPE